MSWSTTWARIFDILADSYTDVGIATWLNARNRNLNLARPRVLIDEGQSDAVLAEARWVAGS
jgi:hypothetical protein